MRRVPRPSHATALALILTKTTWSAASKEEKEKIGAAVMELEGDSDSDDGMEDEDSDSNYGGKETDLELDGSSEEVKEITRREFKSLAKAKTKTAAKKATSIKTKTTSSNKKQTTQQPRLKSSTVQSKTAISPTKKKLSTSKSRKHLTTKKTPGDGNKAPGDAPISSSSSSEAEDGDPAVVDIPKGGRKAVKVAWAFEQFYPTPGTSRGGDPIWIKDYSKETLPRPKSSNYISHLTGPTANCQIPEEAQYENVGKEQPTSEMLPQASGYAAQWKLMFDFTVCSKASPARKPFSKNGFRVAFVKAVLEDGLSFSFGENEGMKNCSDTLFQRDLDVLYTSLQHELWAMIKVFWISADCVLQAHVLDLIHLNDDHGGKAAGKLIFASLKESGAAKKMTAENTSSNNVAHRAIAKRQSKVFGVSVNPETMGIGCAGHVIHLAAQDLLAAFEVMKSSDIVDYFHDTNRQYGIYYSADTDREIVEQEAKDNGESGEEESKEEDGSDSDSNNGEREESGANQHKGGALNPLTKICLHLLTGKKLEEARKLQGKLYISFPEWDLVSQLCNVLEVFQIATLDVSRSNIPTLPMVLPLYKQIEATLEQAINSAQESTFASVTISEKGYQAALNKLSTYIAATCNSSPLHLIATGK
ncbi:hypothetical protein FRB90_012755 [Tulasnella sp. 427]|nr:hypothetical protein FRB90_012755 [Tulasnella sp. 427]